MNPAASATLPLIAAAILAAAAALAQNWTYYPYPNDDPQVYLPEDCIRNDIGFEFAVRELSPGKLSVWDHYTPYITSGATVDFSAPFTDGYEIVNFEANVMGILWVWLNGLILPDTATNISANAFSGCEYLTHLTLGNGVQTIGAQAFSGCKALGDISLPASVQVLGAGAFSGCRAATNLTLGSGIEAIGDYAFSDCRALPEAVIPASVQTIGAGAFSDCGALTNITIGAGVTNLGAYAFASLGQAVAVTFLGDCPATVGANIYSASQNATTRIHLAHIASWTASPAFTGAFEDGDARWHGNPIICIGYTPPAPGHWVDITAITARPGNDIALTWDAGGDVNATWTHAFIIYSSDDLAKPPEEWVPYDEAEVELTLQVKAKLNSTGERRFFKVKAVKQ